MRTGGFELVLYFEGRAVVLTGCEVANHSWPRVDLVVRGQRLQWDDVAKRLGVESDDLAFVVSENPTSVGLRITPTAATHTALALSTRDAPNRIGPDGPRSTE